VDGIGSGSCQLTDFGVSCVELLGSATAVLVNSEENCCSCIFLIQKLLSSSFLLYIETQLYSLYK
jgi:hypothetical protein